MSSRLKLVPRGSAVFTGTVRVAERPLQLGRDPRCEVVIPDPTVSRQHARLMSEGEELVVEDLGSSGGTYVNGSRVGRAELRSGDLVRLGQRVEFVVSRDEPSTALRDATRGSGEREVRHLQVLLEVARTLNTATVLEDVLDVVLQSAVRLMKADRALLTLLGAGQAHETLITYPRDLPRDRVQARSTLIERAIAGRATVMAKAPDDMSASMIQRGVAEAAATPLLVAHRPLGPHEQASFVGKVEVIGGLLVERDHKSGFGREEMEVLESLAADAAMALDSARLYRESRQKAKIDHEMALARGMQAALLRPPPEVPFARTWAYTRPARIVGGDLYHGILRPDGALALAVGDVSGKGVAAALIMAMVQGLAEMLHDVGLPLAEFLPVLDRNLRRHNPGNRFLTLATALVQPSGHVDLANAGHCPAAVVRADGGIEFREPRGPVLGLLERAVWGSEALALGPGDLLVLYSDGILESTSPGGAEFGLPGIERALRAARGKAPAEIGQCLLEAVAEHRAGSEAEDDVTVLVTRFGPG
jgi:sigma-B regulation protein RsbU (phosphoserine phosphatase)